MLSQKKKQKEKDRKSMCNSSSPENWNLADFVPISNSQCIVNLTVSIVLWSLSAVGHFIASAHAAYSILRMFSKYFECRKQGKQSYEELDVTIRTSNENKDSDKTTKTSKHASVNKKQYSYRLVIATMSAGIVSSGFFLCLSIAKAFQMQSFNIGSNLAATILFIFAGSFWWLYNGLTNYVLLRVQIKNGVFRSKSWRNRLRVYFKLLPFLASLGFLANAAVSLMLLDPSDAALFKPLVAVYFGVTAFVFFLSGTALVRILLNPLVNDLSGAIQGNFEQNDSKIINDVESMKLLLKRTRDAAFTVKLFTIINVPLLLCFAAVPYLQLRASYVLALMSVGISIEQYLVLHFFHN